MKRLLPLFLLLGGCSIDSEPRVCDYSVLLRYGYNEENTTTENHLDQYVNVIDEWIFDEGGVLAAVAHVEKDPCRTHLDSELKLPPGRYSVIAVGNCDGRSQITDERTGAQPVVGVTKREDMRLTLASPTLENRGENPTWGPSEELYYGYQTFSISKTGAARVRVEMANAHMRLKFRITWKGGTTPSRGSGLYATLTGISSRYQLMPELVWPVGCFDCQNHRPDQHDTYAEQTDAVVHHQPLTGSAKEYMLVHSTSTRLNGDGELWGEMVSYRMRADAHPILKLMRESGRSDLPDEAVLPRQIDLTDYLQQHEQRSPDHELKQAYDLDIQINKDQSIWISSLTAGDWEEGTLW